MNTVIGGSNYSELSINISPRKSGPIRAVIFRYFREFCEVKCLIICTTFYATNNEDEKCQEICKSQTKRMYEMRIA